MLRLSEPDYLAVQYKTADNLDARRDLHARFSTEQYSWLQWVFDQIEEGPFHVTKNPGLFCARKST